MTDLFGIGISALQAYQRALATTGHNVANANTPGYSRQRVLLSERPPQYTGAGFVGSGVQVASIERVFDALRASQLDLATSGTQRLTALLGIAQGVSNRLADEQLGLGASLSRLTSALEDVATDPSSVPARQALLAELQGQAETFQRLSSYLDSQQQAVEQGLRDGAGSVNTLARNIADLNRQIVVASASGNPPNDLLDARSRMLNQLSELVGTTTAQESNGAIDVFIGSGQALVVGANASQLALARNTFDAERVDLVIGGVPVTSQISGGKLGGLLDAQSEVITPTRNELGRMAAALSLRVNELNSQGLDLDGRLGGPLLSAPSATVKAAATNTGSATVGVAFADTGAFRADEYVLSYDGSNYQLRSATTGSTIAMTGSGTAADPFQVDGLQIVVSAGAAAGDRFLVQPFRTAASTLSVVETDPRRIAAAAPLRAATDPANTGSVGVTALNVLDSSVAGFLDPVTIDFTSPTTYTINGTGSYTYTPGSPIQLNGYELQLGGVVATGDRITVRPNFGATGDNANALRLAGVTSEKILDGGAGSLVSANSTLIARAGSTAQQVELASRAQEAIRTEAEAAVASVSGVNLDEEAANLMRYQQAYQAMAQVIGVADTTFQSLLAALRG